MRWVVFSAGLLLAVLGVLSFLVPVTPLISALLLIFGAIGLVWTSWFWTKPK